MSLKIYYFASSHWDREWYQTFQQFRYYLMAMGQELLDCLENSPEFKVFNFDGQSIVLEDILEIKPELRERFEALIKAGRLNIGPWYVQPDEFLVSGEALIHNLLIGHEIAREFEGTPWKVGYLCDIFGHIAQMPQILCGFDIDNAVAWRGMPENTGAYFKWQAPDGSETLALRLPEFQGYGDFSGQVAGFWNKPLAEEEFKKSARIYVDKLIQENGEQPILLMDGVDHAPVHSAAPQYIEWLKELYPDAEVYFSNINDLVASVKSPENTVVGELAYTARRQGGFMNLITHTLSSYYPLKKANDECQDLLEMLISPLVAAAGRDQEFLKKAWRYLIQNHAHDSICGCSIDQVHKDMEYRFDQVIEIADALVGEFIARDRNKYTGNDIQDECHHISGGVTQVVPNGKNGELVVRFFNPLPYEREEVRNFEVVFPSEYSTTYAEPFGYETINSFLLEDEDGKILPYNISNIKCSYTKRFYRYDARQYNCYDITSKVCLKPFAWTTLKVVPSEKPVRYFESQLTGYMSAETSLIRLNVNRDGTFDITDKRSGRSFKNLNVFIADSEIGDGWNHVTPKGSAACISTGANSTVKLIEDSPDRTVFEISQEIKLPKEVEYRGTMNENYAGIVQSSEEKVVKLSTQIILDAGSALLKLHTEIDNNVKDYRLRMLLPTGISGKYFAHQAFCFLERDPGRGLGNMTADWKEPEQIEKNFSHIAGKQDHEGGIAFFSKAGLHELGSVDNENGEFYITFLRSIRRTVASNGGERCQLQGRISWDYGLYLMDSNESYGNCFRQSQLYRCEPINYTAHYNEGYNADDESVLTLESANVCMSIIKPVESGGANELIVRLTNFEDSLEKVVLKTSQKISECRITNMEERCMQQVKVEKNRIILELKPKKIETVKIKLIEKV